MDPAAGEVRAQDIAEENAPRKSTSCGGVLLSCMGFATVPSVHSDEEQSVASDGEGGAVVGRDYDTTGKLGQVWAWGINRNLVVGVANDRTFEDGSQNTICEDPEFVSGLRGQHVKAVAGGDNHSLALTVEGILYVWGGGYRGYEILGNKAMSTLPTPLHLNRKIAQVAAGRSHTLALTEGGDVYSWGAGEHGRLGHGDFSPRFTPTIISELRRKRVRYVAAGGWHSMVVLEKGGICAFGYNRFGQLGIGNNVSHVYPQAIKMFKDADVKKIACARQTTFVLLEGGKLYAFGGGKYGRLGLGLSNNQMVPKYVDCLGNHRLADVSAGDWHTAAVSENGILFTWGCNEYGQLGLGDTAHQGFPRAVRSLSDKRITGVACGAEFTLAVTEDKMVYRFGDTITASKISVDIEKGDGVSLPVQVEDLEGMPVHSVACGRTHMMVIT